eukprot:XP_001704410.1 Hypothetical protein GL50803_37905 [Giardia lamblia ATCC 50803]
MPMQNGMKVRSSEDSIMGSVLQWRKMEQAVRSRVRSWPEETAKRHLVEERRNVLWLLATRTMSQPTQSSTVTVLTLSRRTIVESWQLDIRSSVPEREPGPLHTKLPRTPSMTMSSNAGLIEVDLGASESPGEVQGALRQGG